MAAMFFLDQIIEKTDCIPFYFEQGGIMDAVGTVVSPGFFT
jgi:hypothetical protein